MRVYLLRHGIAEDASGGMTDYDRRLTAEGAARMSAIAEVYRDIGLRVDRIVTSPLPRASETAAIVAKLLGLQDRLTTDDRIGPGFRLGDLQRIVGEHARTASIMLVGHQPDLGLIAGELTGSALLEIRKGGLVRINAARVEPGAGTLEWLMPPSAVLRSAAD